jgi:hypothetical protein
LIKLTIGYQHDSKNHLYRTIKKETKDGITYELQYENDIPKLTLQSKTDNNHIVGYYQGYLLAPQISKLLETINPIMRILVLFREFPIATDKVNRKIFQKLKQEIPKDYLNEMIGIVTGYNAFLSESPHMKLKSLTLNEVVLFHYLPEIHHMKKFKTIFADLLATGCTSGVTRIDGDIVMMRNMDWFSHNIAKYTIVIEKQIRDKCFIDNTFPLCVGVITGMNKYGLCVSVNISPGRTTKIRGLPAILNNRQILDNCKSVQEVLEKVNTDKSYSPNGPYHATLADDKTGGRISFYLQKEKISTLKNIHKYRSFDVPEYGDINLLVKDIKDNRLTLTANVGITYNRDINVSYLYNHHNSYERISNIACYIEKNELSVKTIINAFKLPLVNNVETVHHMRLDPKNKTLYVAFDNNFAADKKMMPVKMKYLD